MDAATFKRLLEDVRNDEQLFHALVFNPKEALGRLDYLGEDAQRTRRRVDPAAIVALAVGDMAEWIDESLDWPGFEQSACGPEYTCSCTSWTCHGTCGGSTCMVTCSGESCWSTCGDSCGWTTNLTLPEARPARWT
jgi:hypothetical protein